MFSQAGAVTDAAGPAAPAGELCQADAAAAAATGSAAAHETAEHDAAPATAGRPGPGSSNTPATATSSAVATTKIIKVRNFNVVTVEHTYDACPKYSELGSFRIIAYLYVSDGSGHWQRQYSKKKVQRFYV